MIAASNLAGLPGEQVLIDVVATLALAVALGMLLQKLRQSVVPGYLIAGLLLGPGAFGVVEDTETFSAMGELGIALLLFTIGLELHVSHLREMGRRTLRGGLLQIALTLAVALVVLRLFDVGWAAAAAIAMAVSLSSTAVVMRVLADRAETDSVHGLAALGVLLPQDLATVPFLIIIPQLAHGGDAAEVARGVGTSLAALVGLVAMMLFVDRAVMRRLFRRGAFGPEREMLALLSIAISLGAVGSSEALGLAPALGGFIAGLIMADAPYTDQVRAEIAPLRMGLVALFFAWVGMLADVSWIIDHPAQIAGVVVAIVVGKFLLTFVSLRVVGVAGFASLIAAAALVQLGEFSFAIIATARDAGLVDDDVFQLFVSSSLITLLMTPPLIAGVSRLVHRPRRRDRRVHATHPEVGGRRHDDPMHEGHVIVIGYGPAGRTVVQTMLDHEFAVVVIELNPRAELRATHPNMRFVFGDATQPEIMERANVRRARIAVVTIPDPAAMRRLVAQLRGYVPDLQIVARARYNMYLDQVREAGADRVVDEETVTGRAIALESLSTMGVAALD